MSTPTEMRANLVKALDALQKTRQKLTALEAAQQEPIAVIGLACRLPGAATPEAFWQLLLDGQDLVTAVPVARWDMDQYYDPVPGKPGKSYVRTGAFLDEVDSFDPQFFGISPREAMLLDPQQRLLLEVTWEALERAGQAPLALQQSKTGVFVGVSPSDYGTLMDEITGTDTYASTGNGVIFASGRLSHFLGLQGPNLVIDTACSASLIGVHLACESLRNRSSDLALAGGVHLMLVPQSYVLLSQLKALAPDGRSKTFDAAANGFGRGEGCGMVVLKRLSDAVAADDTILAVIRGSAINHDGHSGGLTVPSATAQAALIRQALEKAKVAPAEVGYVDAHGTGTALGDPIELRALAAVFGQRTTPLLVGTVKTNLGHLEEAAGVAGLIKVILSMQHGVIPPHLHLHQPTPHIDWDNLPIAVPTTVTPWLHPEGATKKIAGVSSFGMGGSNAHVVVEEAPPTAWTAESQKTALRHEKRPQHLLTLSAKNEAALAALAHRYQAHLAAHPDLALGDLCYTAYTGRSHFSHRVSLVAGSVEQMQQKLMLYSTGKSTPGVQSAIVPDHQAPPLLAFLFTGQGAQYVNMGRELYATEPTFRESIDRCDELLRQYLGESLLALLYPDLDEQAHSPQPTAKIDDTAYTQPALFAVEYALAQVWLAWGIQPDLLLGHSVGELVAACVAGIFSLEDGLKLVAARGRLMSALPQDGAMVSLMATEVQVQAAIGPEHKAVAIAAVNGPESVVISGKREPVLAIAERMAAAGVKTHQLTVSHAFHSPLMEPMLDDFRQVAATIVYRAPQIPLVSNVTGTLRPAQGSVTEPAEMTTPDYWVRHVRAAVRFADGVATLLEQGIRLFLEVGPKPVLSGMVQPVVDANVGSVRATAGKSDQSAKPNACLCLPSVRENQSDWQQMLESVGALYGQGIAIAWAGVDRVQMRRKLVLPTYPFQRRRYWLDPAHQAAPAQPAAKALSPLLQLLADGQWVRVQQQLVATGNVTAELEAALPAILQLLVEPPQQQRAVVFDYYNAVAQLADNEEAHVYGDQAFLTFSIFPEVVPDFSWFMPVQDKVRQTEHQQMARQGQAELRRLLFRAVDFSACRTVMDFGCGYGADLVALAADHPQLTLCGYTISSTQAQIGQQKVAAHQFTDRIQIFCRDSVADPFPQSSDLMIGAEVACHIKDKAALFTNIGAHLNPGGMVVLADFISSAGFPIEHEETASFLVTPEEWLTLFSSQGLKLVQHIDVSREIANFLDDPHFEEHLAELQADTTVDKHIYAATVSYHNQQKLMRQGLLRYALFAAQQQNELTGDELVAWNRALLDSPTTYAEITPTQWLYDVQWEPTPLPAAPLHTGGGQWLILADPQGVGEQLAARLFEQGDQALLIWPGTHLEKRETGWQVDPLAMADFQHLLCTELANGRPLRGIVHLWSLHSHPSPAPPLLPTALPTALPTLAELEQGLVLSCGSTLSLLQALIQVDTPALPLWLVTQDAVAVAGSVPAIGPSALWGLAGTMAQEHPEYPSVRLDLEATAASDNGRRLYQEILQGSSAARVAYRQGVRYVAHLGRFVAASTLHTDADLTIRSEGSYLITGGTGGLGIQVAQWLANKGARHLILTSRRGLTSQAARTLAEGLMAAGVQLHVLQGDVANPDDLARLLQTIQRDLPPLRGLIHAAGVVEPTPLRDLSWASFQQVTAPKLQGGWQLYTLLAAADLMTALDFCVYFSSASAVLDTSGVGSYAAANAFLDGLAAYQRAAGLPTLSINWGPWDETGMADAYRAEAAAPVRNHGMGLIDAKQGLALLATLLQQAVAQVAVLPVNWGRYRHLVPTAQAAQFLARFLPVVPDQPTNAAQDSLRATVTALSPQDGLAHLVSYLQEAVAHILRMETPPLPNERFFDLGMDSLMAVELRNRLQQGTGISLSATLFFKYSNIEALATYFLEEFSTAAMPKETDTAALLNDKIDSLDDNTFLPMSLDTIVDLSETEVEASIAAALAKLTGQLNQQ